MILVKQKDKILAVFHREGNLFAMKLQVPTIYSIAIINPDCATTMSLTLLLDGGGNPTWSQVGANWPRHIFYGQLSPLCVLWHPCHNTFPWPFYGLSHILPSLAFLANSHFTNPQAFIFDFGLGGSFCLLGASRPPSPHPWIQGHPFHYWGFGLNGLFGPFGPPTARGP
ncbi:hypothetical protein O181_051796 [Austropuccinia psidii MF-1]|uniref:Uncharacterized protein n=1 Tax=Austropuccinia psidii MF-1 TaxID=1389203 RepID=A0A9Q3HNN5_9BASI|nr:hypothetical protein [Austropuccinia psidii MF-1]